MRRLIVGLLFSISLNPACSSSAVGDEEYEVYSFLIDSMFKADPFFYTYVVVGDRTIVPPRAKKEVREQWSLLTHAAWSDFDDKNRQSWPLVDRFFTGTRCYLVDLGSPYDRSAFRKRFPNSGATVVLSRVGFASRNRFAIVYVHDLNYDMGYSPALHRYYFLARDGTGWRILGDFGRCCPELSETPESDCESANSKSRPDSVRGLPNTRCSGPALALLASIVWW